MPRSAKPEQAFIVVSTGQNLANLPPVLECAESGEVGGLDGERGGARLESEPGRKKEEDD